MGMYSIHVIWFQGLVVGLLTFEYIIGSLVNVSLTNDYILLIFGGQMIFSRKFTNVRGNYFSLLPMYCLAKQLIKIKETVLDTTLIFSYYEWHLT